MRELGLEFVETWLAETDRDVADHTGHRAADAVFFVAVLGDQR